MLNWKIYGFHDFANKVTVGAAYWIFSSSCIANRYNILYIPTRFGIRQRQQKNVSTERIRKNAKRHRQASSSHGGNGSADEIIVSAPSRESRRRRRRRRRRRSSRDDVWSPHALADYHVIHRQTRGRRGGAQPTSREKKHARSCSGVRAAETKREQSPPDAPLSAGAADPAIFHHSEEAARRARSSRGQRISRKVRILYLFIW